MSKALIQLQMTLYRCLYVIKKLSDPLLNDQAQICWCLWSVILKGQLVSTPWPDCAALFDYIVNKPSRLVISQQETYQKQYFNKNFICKFNQRKQTFSLCNHTLLSWSLLIIFCIYVFIKYVVLIANSCNVHVLYKIIFCNKFDLFWT